MGLIAKLNEIKEQLDSCSSGNEEDDQDEENKECIDESRAPSRQEPNSSETNNHHLSYAKSGDKQ